MTSFRDLVNHAAAPVDSTASTGQTAYNSLAMGAKMSSIVRPSYASHPLQPQLTAPNPPGHR